MRADSRLFKHIDGRSEGRHLFPLAEAGAQRKVERIVPPGLLADTRLLVV